MLSLNSISIKPENAAKWKGTLLIYLVILMANTLIGQEILRI